MFGGLLGYSSGNTSTSTVQPQVINYGQPIEEKQKNSSIHDIIVIENCSVQDCFNVIAQIERYPEFIGVYSKVEILSRSSGDPNNQTMIAKYYVHTTFKNITYTLRLQQICHGSQAQVRYDLVEGPFSHHSGGWDLIQRGNHVEAHYHIDLQFSFGVPKMVRNWVMNSVLQSSMSSIKQRVQEVSVGAN